MRKNSLLIAANLDSQLHLYQLTTTTETILQTNATYQQIDLQQLETNSQLHLHQLTSTTETILETNATYQQLHLQQNETNYIN